MSVNTLIKDGILTNINCPVEIIPVKAKVGEVHYNPGLARDPSGKLFISVRSCITNFKEKYGVVHPLGYENFLHVGVLDGHIITVPIDRLDNLIGDEQIDIMKIDCEGHSLEVVEGLGNKIKQVKCFHIETEKWTDSNIKLKPIMQNHGYILVDETEQYGGMPDQVWIRQ